jgi:hypothetical protein
LFLGEAIVSCEGVVRGGRLIRSIVKTEADRQGRPRRGLAFGGTDICEGSGLGNEGGELGGKRARQRDRTRSESRTRGV